MVVADDVAKSARARIFNNFIGMVVLCEVTSESVCWSDGCVSAAADEVHVEPGEVLSSVAEVVCLGNSVASCMSLKVYVSVGVCAGRAAVDVEATLSSCCSTVFHLSLMLSAVVVEVVSLLLVSVTMVLCTMTTCVECICTVVVSVVTLGACEASGLEVNPSMACSVDLVVMTVGSSVWGTAACDALWYVVSVGRSCTMAGILEENDCASVVSIE